MTSRFARASRALYLSSARQTAGIDRSSHVLLRVLEPLFLVSDRVKNLLGLATLEAAEGLEIESADDGSSFAEAPRIDVCDGSVKCLDGVTRPRRAVSRRPFRGPNYSQDPLPRSARQ